MIKYNVTKNDIKIQAKDLAVFKLKPLLIIGAVALPLSIFFLIVGYAASEPEALKMGYPTLLIFALSVVMFVAQYSAFGKALLASFEKVRLGNKKLLAFPKQEDILNLLQHEN